MSQLVLFKPKCNRFDRLCSQQCCV